MGSNWFKNTRKAKETGYDLGTFEAFTHKNTKADNDAWLSFHDLAKNQGLNEESFEVITEDGYRLNVQHIWSD